MAATGGHVLRQPPRLVRAGRNLAGLPRRSRALAEGPRPVVIMGESRCRSSASCPRGRSGEPALQIGAQSGNGRRGIGPTSPLRQCQQATDPVAATWASEARRGQEDQGDPSSPTMASSSSRATRVSSDHPSRATHGATSEPPQRRSSASVGDPGQPRRGRAHRREAGRAPRRLPVRPGRACWPVGSPGRLPATPSRRRGREAGLRALDPMEAAPRRRPAGRPDPPRPGRDRQQVPSRSQRPRLRVRVLEAARRAGHGPTPLHRRRGPGDPRGGPGDERAGDGRGHRPGGFGVPFALDPTIS